MRVVVATLMFVALSACAGTGTEPFQTPAVAADESTPQTRTVDLANADRASLLAWKEALGPSYPLTIRGRDTVSALVQLVAPSGATWTPNTTTGNPMIAAFYTGNELSAEYGFIETSHGQGGVFVMRRDSTLYSRPASGNDISRFMAFFGIGVVVIE